jgi:hypothetical protein
MGAIIALPFLMLFSAAVEEKLRKFHRQGMARVARFDERERGANNGNNPINAPRCVHFTYARGRGR